MDAQIVVAAATAIATTITVGVTLGLALLSGFRRLHDKIDQTAKELRKDNRELREDSAKQFQELRKDNRELHRAIGKNAEAIAGIKGRMAVIENLLNAILKAVLPQPAQAPTGTTAPQAEAERDRRSEATAIGAAAGSQP